jgi:hypothetical protein
VHIGFSVLLLIVILIFNALNDKSVINQLFRAAGYTYGPLLGLFAFGQLTRLSIKDNLAPLVCVLSPIVSFIIDTNSKEWLGGFEFGFFILLLNGSLTFIGLLLISRFKSNRNLSVSAS